MKLRERYRRLSLWNKIAFWGGVTSIVGFLLAFASFFVVPDNVAPARVPYPPSATAAEAFLKELGSLPVDRERVRLGCAAADEQACAVTSAYLDLFVQAGWPLTSERVERVQLGKPRAGVVLMKRGATTDPPPPGSGVWVQQSPSLVAIRSAFRKAGLPVSLAADATMPEGVIGVFVGPAPSEFK